MTTRKALIVGATGLIGGFCLQALLNDPNYSEVIALVRRPILKTHRKLKTVITTFDNLVSEISSIQVNDVYCCLGTTIKKAGSQEAFKLVAWADAIRHFSRALELITDAEALTRITIRRGRAMELNLQYTDALANYEQLEAQALQYADKKM